MPQALKNYAKSVRRNWIYFLLIVLAALLAAWIVLNIGRDASRMGSALPDDHSVAQSARVGAWAEEILPR